MSTLAYAPTHTLHLLTQPLHGLPSNTPYLHARLILSPLYLPTHSLHLDLLPLSPLHPCTISNLLALRCVPAQARVQRKPFPSHGGVKLVDRGVVRADNGRVERWVLGYEGCECGGGVGISLKESCWRFVRELETLLREGELA